MLKLLFPSQTPTPRWYKVDTVQIVGLPDKSVEEAKERISSALKNCVFKHPRAFDKRTVINLAPADLKKEGGDV